MVKTAASPKGVAVLAGTVALAATIQERRKYKAMAERLHTQLLHEEAKVTELTRKMNTLSWQMTTEREVTEAKDTVHQTAETAMAFAALSTILCGVSYAAIVAALGRYPPPF
jgi:hypothetical protein